MATFGYRLDVIYLHPFDRERLGTTITQTSRIFVHFASLFLGEMHPLALLAEEIVSQLFDETPKSLVRKLDVVSLALYVYTFVADQSGIVGIGGEVGVAIVEVEVDGRDVELLIIDFQDVVV